jgi:carbamoyltransferase
MKNLCLAGGVALNCVANGRLLREGPFDNIWIQPAAGDAGGALGAALFTWHQLMGAERRPQPTDSMQGALLGPAFTDDEIKAVLQAAGACYHYYDHETMLERVVQLLDQQKVVGRLQGRMEFGPRALGSRSILGDARSTRMQSVMNLKIKFRESFRPFAPSVLQERASEYFEMDDGVESPYMLLVANVRPEKRVESQQAGLEGMDLLKATRSVVPAITHVDYSARVQTVERHRHATYHELIDRFYQATGCPVIINTSFNVRGEPIVCSPEDALNCFLNTGMDALVMEHFLLLKSEQPEVLSGNKEKYLEAFKLD